MRGLGLIHLLTRQKKKAYYIEELAEANTKTEFKKVYSLLNRNVKILPVYNSPTKQNRSGRSPRSMTDSDML